MVFSHQQEMEMSVSTPVTALSETPVKCRKAPLFKFAGKSEVSLEAYFSHLFGNSCCEITSIRLLILCLLLLTLPTISSLPQVHFSLCICVCVCVCVGGEGCMGAVFEICVY